MCCFYCVAEPAVISRLRDRLFADACLFTKEIGETEQGKKEMGEGVGDGGSRELIAKRTACSSLKKCLSEGSRGGGPVGPRGGSPAPLSSRLNTKQPN